MKTSLEPSQTIQRVKVGMTGLAFVMLLIGLASAIFSSASREPVPATAADGAKPDLIANLAAVPLNETETVQEPLAELGVAPSTATEASNQAATTTPR
ncbi:MULTISPECIES: hypothetical protein [unclassified Sphingomonas]|uniref:hypothetical protein n=1 Tax=unclassified Sphingomonas TaxID=196159 RepID=UPI000BD8C5DA|nr:MAG: hypothetical protein B7Z43_03995 [Sphingomonas sp. 12-62-6]OYX38920.1 MAG: hypothetical protein B7Y98_07345 [Sphingomonas sp. 32-62-10]OYY65810.1 MAG: hypothetical protein B7Y49_04760 [Sphingomonas sp. 28-62-11]